MKLQRQQIVTMLELQNRMNETVRADWIAAGWPFLRAAVVEGAEAMEHRGWKWWKAQSENREQLQMELVDIWHFILSDFIVRSNGNLFDAASTVMMAMREIGVVTDLTFDGNTYALQELDCISKLELLIGLAVSRRVSLPLFDALMTDCGMTWENLVAQYVPKNVLNIFRQDNGYKAGSYVKIWNGREDNEHLVEAMADLDVVDPNYKDKLYDALKRRYRAALAVRCAICKEPMDQPDDPGSMSCGGDCVRCMAAAGDPDCIARMAKHGQEMKA